MKPGIFKKIIQNIKYKYRRRKTVKICRRIAGELACVGFTDLVEMSDDELVLRMEEGCRALIRTIGETGVTIEEAGKAFRDLNVALRKAGSYDTGFIKNKGKS